MVTLFSSDFSGNYYDFEFVDFRNSVESLLSELQAILNQYYQNIKKDDKLISSYHENKKTLKSRNTSGLDLLKVRMKDSMIENCIFSVKELSPILWHFILNHKNIDIRAIQYILHNKLQRALWVLQKTEPIAANDLRRINKNKYDESKKIIQMNTLGRVYTNICLQV